MQLRTKSSIFLRYVDHGSGGQCWDSSLYLFFKSDWTKVLQLISSHSLTSHLNDAWNVAPNREQRSSCMLVQSCYCSEGKPMAALNLSRQAAGSEVTGYKRVTRFQKPRRILLRLRFGQKRLAKNRKHQSYVFIKRLRELGPLWPSVKMIETWVFWLMQKMTSAALKPLN